MPPQTRAERVISAVTPPEAEAAAHFAHACELALQAQPHVGGAPEPEIALVAGENADLGARPFDAACLLPTGSAPAAPRTVPAVVVFAPAQAHAARQAEETGAAVLSCTPFLDLDFTRPARLNAAPTRGRLGAALSIDPRAVWIVACADPEDDPEGAALCALAAVLERLRGLDWRLVVACGPVPARAQGALRLFGPERITVLKESGFAASIETIAACDLLCLPRRGTADVYRVLAAQAAGLAIIAPNTEDIARVCINSRTARLFAPGNVASLENSLSFLMRQRPFLDDMRAAAARYVYDAHDRPNAGVAFAKALRAALSGARQPRE